MGLSASKRVKHTLSTSETFRGACDAAYSEALNLSNHAFPGVPPYQLLSSSARLHLSLSLSSFPLISRWLPSPPSSSQVHSAYRSLIPPNNQEQEEEQQWCLGRAEFGEFAVRLFTAAVMENVGKAVVVRLPVGVAGIAGIGAVSRSGKDLVGAAVGVYALGVAASVYLSLA